jgi:hypothetical protein
MRFTKRATATEKQTTRAPMTHPAKHARFGLRARIAWLGRPACAGVSGRTCADVRMCHQRSSWRLDPLKTAHNDPQTTPKQKNKPRRESEVARI